MFVGTLDLGIFVEQRGGKCAAPVGVHTRHPAALDRRTARSMQKGRNNDIPPSDSDRIAALRNRANTPRADIRRPSLWPDRGILVPDFVVKLVTDTPQGPMKLATILSKEAKWLRALDRYERRPLSRRKFAVRAFDEARRRNGMIVSN